MAEKGYDPRPADQQKANGEQAAGTGVESVQNEPKLPYSLREMFRRMDGKIVTPADEVPGGADNKVPYLPHEVYRPKDK